LVLGAVPKASQSCRSWRSAATLIDPYRREYGIADHNDALGTEPQGDLMRHDAWRRCRNAIEYPPIMSKIR
jgi:hypothetical protein